MSLHIKITFKTINIKRGVSLMDERENRFQKTIWFKND